jgi:hypothetical protein
MSCLLFHGSWVPVGSGLFVISFRAIVTCTEMFIGICEAGYSTVVFLRLFGNLFEAVASIFCEVFCRISGYVLFAACITCLYYWIERGKIMRS